MKYLSVNRAAFHRELCCRIALHAVGALMLRFSVDLAKPYGDGVKRIALRTLFSLMLSKPVNRAALNHHRFLSGAARTSVPEMKNIAVDSTILLLNYRSILAAHTASS